MKKSFAFLTILFTCALSVFAGLFGLSMGMSLEEIAAECTDEPKYIADDRYLIQPTKSHPLFENYIAWVSETNGLYYIKGISREIKTTGYGTEARQEFAKLISPLERKYGRFKRIDRLDEGTLWKSDAYWTSAIAHGARTYEAHWEATEENIADFDGLVTIAAGVKTRETYVTDEAYIWIEYGFLNQIEAFDELDDVL